jgi:cytochrome c oxidase subunit 2
MISKSFFFQYLSFCDAPEPWQLYVQDPATPIMEGMRYFHNYLILIMVFVTIFVMWMLTKVVLKFNHEDNPTPNVFSHSSLLEIVWTIIPALILISIAVPSFALLYSLDELVDPVLTLKVVGHQWYWSYEYSDYYANVVSGEFPTIQYDSYMLPLENLIEGRFRLLEVDNRVVLPTHSHIRLLITAADVLHCWAIPSFGVKLDACPGRLSQASLFIKREGMYYGQCSEICGVNHGFMPIVVEAVSTDEFANWLDQRYLENFED